MIEIRDVQFFMFSVLKRGIILIKCLYGVLWWSFREARLYFAFPDKKKLFCMCIITTHWFWWFNSCQFLYLWYFSAFLQVLQFNPLFKFHFNLCGFGRLIDLTVAFCNFSIIEEQCLKAIKRGYC